MKINLSPNITAVINAHGKTRSYVHRFKIIESPENTCVNGNQTVDHILYDCSKLNNEREKLIAYISKEDNWRQEQVVICGGDVACKGRSSSSIGKGGIPVG